MRWLGKLGGDEGKVTGPQPGEGASSVGGLVAGGADMEGTPPDALPPRSGAAPPRSWSGPSEASPPKTLREGMTLVLSSEERELLTWLLQSTLREKVFELHHTRYSGDYRKHVKQEETLLRGLLDRLEAVAPVT